MADTVRLQLIQAYEAALNGSGKPDGVTIHRSRYRPLEEDELPAIVVYWINEECELSNTAGDLDRRVRLWAECRARGEVADDAVDPLLAWAEEAAMADPRFGGFAKKTVVIGVRQPDPETPILPPLAGAALELEVTYETPGGQPTVAK